jgi:hypothetical protein
VSYHIRLLKCITPIQLKTKHAACLDSRILLSIQEQNCQIN